MNETQISELVAIFFRRLRLSADQQMDDVEIANMEIYIKAGESYINAVASGKSIDYTADIGAQDLLYNYCFYARADCTEKFEKAYQSALLQLRLRALNSMVEEIAEDGSEET